MSFKNLILVPFVVIYLLIGTYLFFSINLEAEKPVGDCQPIELAEGTCKIKMDKSQQRPVAKVTPLIILTWPSMYFEYTEIAKSITN